MELKEVFLRHRRLLAFSQLVDGQTLQERIRNLAWIIDLLGSGDDVWQMDELAILGQESMPFMPVDEIAEALSNLKILRFDAGAQSYRLGEATNIFENGLPSTITEDDCQITLTEFRELLEGGPSQRMVWRRSDLTAILGSTSDFGFHCIASWRSLVSEGNDLGGVPFLWNVVRDGETSPHGNLPASSATIDIVRLAVEPLNLLGRKPTSEQSALLSWAFDRIICNVTVGDDGCGYYDLADDDSYPNAAHPINDSQSRVIRLLVQLIRHDQGYLDAGRQREAFDATLALTRFLLSQQLSAGGEAYDGFWSFHRFDVPVIDSFQILSINSELAVAALESVWELGDTTVNDAIRDSLMRLLAGLRRTAIQHSEMIGWRKHFAGPSGAESVSLADIDGPAPDVDVFATARALFIFAVAQSLGICADANTFISGAFEVLERRWSVRFATAEDDIEFIPYRTPEHAKWSDMTYRITNPVSAVMPYYVLAAARLARLSVPMTLTEPVNNCLNFALENYGGHGFWRDVPTGLAYPSNTAFNMQMLIEYVGASKP